MTVGYGWKAVYKEEGETYMIDKSIIHKKKNKVSGN